MLSQYLYFEPTELYPKQVYDQKLRMLLSEFSFSSLNNCKLIQVLGCHGKSSVVMQLETLLVRCSKSVAVFQPGRLFSLRECVRLMGKGVDHELIENSLKVLESSFRKHSTWMRAEDKELLLALHIFQQLNMEYVILEMKYGSAKYDILPQPYAVVMTRISKDDRTDGECLEMVRPNYAIYTISQQPKEVLFALKQQVKSIESLLKVIAVPETADVLEENYTLAHGIVSDLIKVKLGQRGWDLFHPCRMEHLVLNNQQSILLDSATTRFSIERLFQYIDKNYSEKKIILLYGTEKSLNHEELLNLMDSLSSNSSGNSFLILPSGSHHPSSMHPERLSSFIDANCLNLELMQYGEKFNVSDALKKLSTLLSDYQVICFGSQYFSAEVRRVLFRLNMVRKSTKYKDYCQRPDSFLELERDRALIRYIKAAARKNHFFLTSISAGWVLKLQYGNKSKWIIGNQLGLNDASSAKICTDKAATSSILETSEIPHIPHLLFVNQNQGQFHGSSGVWTKISKQFEKFNKDVVVKINSGGSEGRDVFHCRNQRELEVAVHQLFSKSRDFCMCPYFEAEKEIRVILLDGKLKLMYQKKLPFIIGNGVSSKFQLLQERLKKFGTHVLKEIDIRQFDDEIVPNGKKIHLGWKMNLSLGATVEDYHNEEVLRIAQETVRALNVRFVSVDILKKGKEIKVLEVNGLVWIEKFKHQKGEQGKDVAYRIYNDAVMALFS